MEKPKLLLHICCAPCAILPIELLQSSFNIVGFFYNPNIHPLFEYHLRLEETKKYIALIGISFLIEKNEIYKWIESVYGLASVPEGGTRCLHCIHMRLEKTCLVAKRENYKFFATTLSCSPRKPSKKIMELGTELAKNYNLEFYPVDSLIQNNTQRIDAIQRSKQLGLYRQHYCGCIYSYCQTRNAT